MTRVLFVWFNSWAGPTRCLFCIASPTPKTPHPYAGTGAFCVPRLASHLALTPNRPRSLDGIHLRPAIEAVPVRGRRPLLLSGGSDAPLGAQMVGGHVLNVARRGHPVPGGCDETHVDRPAWRGADETCSRAVTTGNVRLGWSGDPMVPVFVTRAQVAAARAMVARLEARGCVPSAAVVKMANARRQPCT